MTATILVCITISALATVRARAVAPRAHLLNAVTHTIRRALYPSWWLREAQCIHSAETGQNGLPYRVSWPRLWHDRDNPSSRGGVQFEWGTWAADVARHHLRGYPADPAAATPAQQLYAAWLLWRDDGGSWHEWSTARGCGLT